MTETSKIAYEQAKASGLLSERRLQVFEDICDYGPCTQLQTWRRIAPNSATGAIATRFSELAAMDLIEKCGEKRDDESGALNTLWYITGRPAKEITKPEAHAQFTNAFDEGFKAAINAILEKTIELAKQAKIPYQTRIEIEAICREVSQ